MTDYNEPTRLNREELKMMAHIDARNLKAMKNRDKQTEEPMNYSSSEETDIMDDTPDKLSNVWRKEMAFLTQSEDISNNAIENAFGEPTKIKSEITQEMIDDYNAEHNTPLVLNGKSYPYHPDRLNIDLETFTPKDPGFDLADEPAARQYQARLMKEHATKEQQIIHLNTVERKNINDAYDAEQAKLKTNSAVDLQVQSLQAEIDRVDKLTQIQDIRGAADQHGVVYKPNQKGGTIRNAVLKKLNKDLTKLGNKANVGTREEIEERYQSHITALGNTIDRLNEENAELLFRYQNIDDAINTATQIDNDNRVEKARVDVLNADKLRTIEEELATLNKGPMAPQGAGESDEDYKQRLISTGQTLLNESSIQDQAESNQLYRCKKYLKAFLSDAGKISTTANKLSADERYEFNKFNAPITKKYLDTYGFNNKDITEEEIATFIRETITTKNFVLPASAPASAPLPLAQKPAPAPAAAPVAGITAKDALLQFSRDNNLRPRATSTVPQLYRNY